MTDHQKALAKAAADYRKLLAARESLIETIRAADADGMRQVDILTATGHVWTREQVRRVCLDDAPRGRWVDTGSGPGTVVKS